MDNDILNEKFGDAIIEGLFPTPVYFSHLKRPLSKEEKKLVAQSKKKTFRNVGNISSSDTYILEAKPFKKLKKELLSRVEHFFYNVLCYKDAKPYITQSWLNYTEPNEHHHGHEHPNSIISGVFYIDAPDKNMGNLYFENGKEYEPIPNRLILFPADLKHGVKPNLSNQSRISMSFNYVRYPEKEMKFPGQEYLKSGIKI